MKKFIVKFATVILYVLMVAYLSGFKIGLLLDWKALAAVFSGSLLFSIPAVFNTDSRSSWRDTVCKNIVAAGYIATFLFLFARLNQPKGYENLLADIALNCRPLLYSLILYILLKPEKPSEEDELAGDLTEKSESTRENCETEGSDLQETEHMGNMKNIQKESAQKGVLKESAIAVKESAAGGYESGTGQNADKRDKTAEQIYYAFRNKGLTQREAEVARLACSGRSNKEIAEELVISETTVKKHMQHIFEKLEIGSREELRNM